MLWWLQRSLRLLATPAISNVSRKCADDSIKLNFLIKNCEGDAKSLIKDCVLLKTDAFKKAVELLQEEYGKKTDIAADYLQFLKSGQEKKEQT